MLVRDIERALILSEEDGYGFTDMSLKRGALIQLCRRLQPRAEPYRILELGGGQSTLFWHAVAQLRLLNLEVFVLEHEKTFAEDLQEKMNVKNRSGRDNLEQDEQDCETLGQAKAPTPYIHICPQQLRQISDADREEIFSQPGYNLSAWNECGQLLGPEFDRSYTIRNTFYSDLQQLNFQLNSIDVLVSDGPHGNGRSLAYPLFAPFLHQEAYLLIDDADHYPFQEDAERILNLNLIYKEHWGAKKWVLLQRKTIDR